MDQSNISSKLQVRVNCYIHTVMATSSTDKNTRPVYCDSSQHINHFFVIITDHTSTSLCNTLAQSKRWHTMIYNQTEAKAR